MEQKTSTICSPPRSTFNEKPVHKHLGPSSRVHLQQLCRWNIQWLDHQETPHQHHWQRHMCSNSKYYPVDFAANGQVKRTRSERGRCISQRFLGIALENVGVLEVIRCFLRSRHERMKIDIALYIVGVGEIIGCVLRSWRTSNWVQAVRPTCSKVARGLMFRSWFFMGN